jgi:hypothetical protein
MADRPPVWTDEQIATLRRMTEEHATIEQIAKAVGRTVRAVTIRRSRMGLAPTPPLGSRPYGRKPGKKKPKEKPVSKTPRIGGPGRCHEKGMLYDGNLPHCALTDDIFKSIVDLVAAGNHRVQAVRSTGVEVSTYNNWMTTGREQIEEYREGKRQSLPRQAQLVLAIERAEGRCFTGETAKILGNGDVKDRTLRFAFSQKRFPKVWAAPTTAIDDETGKQQDVDIMDLLVARLQALKDASP